MQYPKCKGSKKSWSWAPGSGWAVFACLIYACYSSFYPHSLIPLSSLLSALPSLEISPCTQTDHTHSTSSSVLLISSCIYTHTNPGKSSGDQAITLLSGLIFWRNRVWLRTPSSPPCKPPPPPSAQCERWCAVLELQMLSIRPEDGSEALSGSFPDINLARRWWKDRFCEEGTLISSYVYFSWKKWTQV